MSSHPPSDGADRSPDGDAFDRVEWANWILGAVVVGIVGVYVYQFAVPSGAAALVGQEAPDVEAETLEGATVQLADYRGRVVVMDFWATWCPPCHAQMRHMKEFVGTSPDEQGPVVLLVNTDDAGPNRRQKVQTYLKRRKVTQPTLLDDGSIQQAFRVTAFPTLVVVGPNGTIQFAESGVHGPGELREIVDDARR